jgi:hypothetical protein
MIPEHEGRPIRLTATGDAITRDTRLYGVTGRALEIDLVVQIINPKNGQIMFDFDVDTSTSSPFIGPFDPPLRFKDGIGVNFSHAKAGSSVTLFVVEPTDT